MTLKDQIAQALTRPIPAKCGCGVDGVDYDWLMDAEEQAAVLSALAPVLEQWEQASTSQLFVNEKDGPMPTLAMDADGYPDEATLDAIRRWPCGEGRLARLFDEIARIWHWGYGLGELTPYEREFVRADGAARYLRLATGGWSGNEELIAALRQNVMARTRWRASAVGGLHIYEYPQEQP